MEYNEAAKLARKIKRCIQSIPDDTIVIITSSRVDICSKEELYEYEEQHGHLDNPPVIASEIFGNGKVIGFENQM